MDRKSGTPCSILISRCHLETLKLQISYRSRIDVLFTSWWSKHVACFIDSVSANDDIEKYQQLNQQLFLKDNIDIFLLYCTLYSYLIKTIIFIFNVWKISLNFCIIFFVKCFEATSPLRLSTNLAPRISKSSTKERSIPNSKSSSLKFNARRERWGEWGCAASMLRTVMVRHGRSVAGIPRFRDSMLPITAASIATWFDYFIRGRRKKREGERENYRARATAQHTNRKLRADFGTPGRDSRAPRNRG